MWDLNLKKNIGVEKINCFQTGTLGTVPSPTWQKVHPMYTLEPIKTILLMQPVFPMKLIYPKPIRQPTYICSQCYRNLRQMANFTAKLDFRKCFNNGLVALTRAFTLKLKLLFLASYCSSSYKKT